VLHIPTRYKYSLCVPEIKSIQLTMSKQEDQKFTEEAVTYGHTSSGDAQIPVVDDSKYPAEGMDAMDNQVKDSDAQLGICP
jgi:hypothetical protein